MLGIILISLILIIFVMGIGIYNSLVLKKNQIDRSFSSVDVLLKKRCDLIPNLVAVVKQHMQFEQKTLAEITRLRSQVLTGNISQDRRLVLENQISRTMGNLLATIENYPELQSDHHVSQLLATLTEVEEQISAARRFFNTAVTEYNNALEMFPSNIIANMMGYRLRTVFVATAQERQNIDVDQIFNN
ncbi:MAG: LemA family protein [Xenococcus sp. MO_188.B8]|nr:LemA family protein [Xenococcus sp. MO_188.B8]